jgi:hypothetical protein|uniref:Uncharacterized protein n=1 Tax=Podoviridae sp. ctdKF3 TaxID=2825261 RepID=A0A8S5PR90_9CAUD|nr:MAG TPA: hypothetical protein [Podoviridae sp. ctdKF3]
MCDKNCKNCTCQDDTITIKKSVYNHLIKTSNVVRTRNRELEEQCKEWKHKLIKTKKLNRKQKRLIRSCIQVALMHDDFSELHYNDCMELLRFLK